MKRNEAWIFIQSGSVSEVRATDPTLRVHVIDYDELAVSDENKKLYQKLEALSEGETVVF